MHRLLEWTALDTKDWSATQLQRAARREPGRHGAQLLPAEAEPRRRQPRGEPHRRAGQLQTVLSHQDDGRLG